MNGNLRNVWIALAIQQVGSYRQATAVMTKSFETGWLLGPQAQGKSSQPRRDEPLNPMEFHGKRQSEWSPQPPSD